MVDSNPYQTTLLLKLLSVLVSITAGGQPDLHSKF